MSGIYQTIITSLSAIIVAAMGGVFALAQHKSAVAAKKLEAKQAEEKKKTEARAEERAKESLLILQMQKATMDLTLANTKKLFEMKINGDLEKAFNEAEMVNKEYEYYDMGLHAEHMVYGKRGA